MPKGVFRPLRSGAINAVQAYHVGHEPEPLWLSLEWIDHYIGGAPVIVIPKKEGRIMWVYPDMYLLRRIRDGHTSYLTQSQFEYRYEEFQPDDDD